MTAFQVPRHRNVPTVAPQVCTAVHALDTVARDGLDAVLPEPVQIRAARINRCPYRIDHHTLDPRRAGESEERIHRLSGWEDADPYAGAERAALALAEAVTRLPAGVPDGVHDDAARHSAEPELAPLIAVTFTATLRNGMNVTTRRTPGAA
jgi:AhpD family alkylhydroperoxidase